MTFPEIILRPAVSEMLFDDRAGKADMCPVRKEENIPKEISTQTCYELLYAWPRCELNAARTNTSNDAHPTPSHTVFGRNLRAMFCRTLYVHYVNVYCSCPARVIPVRVFYRNKLQVPSPGRTRKT